MKLIVGRNVRVLLSSLFSDGNCKTLHCNEEGGGRLSEYVEMLKHEVMKEALHFNKAAHL